MIHDESRTKSGRLGHEPVPPPLHVVCPEGDPAEVDLDVDDMVRLLDQVWPRPDSEQEPRPRQFGRFSILGELGRGGFGIVYLAEDPLLKRKVALKLPRLGVLSGGESWRRFLRESQAASRLEHPNLIPLLEAGTVGPAGYIVSAYVAGPSLEQWLRRRECTASPRWAAQVVAALARAMEHAHQRGILHRDLKPANVVLYAPECADEAPGSRAWEGGNIELWVPRICDFGMAKLREAEGDETRSRIACGSPSYMAPEQAEARQSDIDATTDVYGLGAILYQVLTGRPPFSGKNDLETLRQVVNEEPVALRKLRPGLPRDLETICLKCLAKKPGQRYATAAALADDLDRFLDGRPIQARRVATWERGWRWARRRPASAALATAVLAAVGAGIGGLLWHNTRLNEVNTKLRVASIEANASAQEARNQKIRAETHERLVRRQIAGRHVFNAQSAVMARDFDRALRLLDFAEPEFGTPGNRDFACTFLGGESRKLLEVLDGERGAVRRIANSPDGRTIAFGDNNGAITLWDLPTGDYRLLASDRSKEIHYLVFSPDGRTVGAATAGSGEIFLWDVASGGLRGTLERSAHRAISGLLFSRDSVRLEALGNQKGAGVRSLELWDLRSPLGTFPILDPEKVPATVAEMADARLRLLAEMIDDPSPSWSGSFTDLQQSWLERAPRGIERTRDLTIGLVAQGDGAFEVWWLQKRVCIALGRIHAHGCALVFVDPVMPGWLLTPALLAARERLARKLIPHAAGKPRPPNVIVRLEHFELTAAFSHDGSRLAVWNEHNENRLKIIDLSTGLACSTFDLAPLNDLRSVYFTRDDTTLAFGEMDRKLRLWHLRPASNPIVLRGHTPYETWSLAFAPDKKILASAGDDHCIRLWNLETGEEKAVLRGHDALVTSIAFAPDGRTLASASFDILKPVALWDAETWTLRSILRGHIDFARAVSFSPDGRVLASGSDDRSVILYDVIRARRTATLSNRSSGVIFAALSPDGQMLASTDRNVVVLTDFAKDANRSIDTGGTEIYSLVFTADGSHVITGHGDGSINTWDVDTGRLTQTLSPHANIVFGLALSPDGRTLASAGEDRTVRVWDISTGQELLRLTDCKARVNAVAFSPDGTTLAAADHTGAITLWRAAARPALSQSSPVSDRKKAGIQVDKIAP